MSPAGRFSAVRPILPTFSYVLHCLCLLLYLFVVASLMSLRQGEIPEYGAGFLLCFAPF